MAALPWGARGESGGSSSLRRGPVGLVWIPVALLLIGAIPHATAGGETPAGLRAAAPASAENASGVTQSWCDQESRYQHCEVREYTLQARDGRLQVSARPNGGITVEGWDGSEVRVEARVSARAGSRGAAARLAEEVTVEITPGSVRTDGPRARSGWRDESWQVSYRILVPTGTELELEALNGGIRVSGVRAGVTVRTTNGGVRLEDVDGVIRAHSTNGSVHATFRPGFALRHSGELRTTNGGVTLVVPGGLSARLEASTTNGSIHTDFPVTVQGRIGRRLSAEIGGGGPELRLRTTNGSIRLSEG